jgi:predicted deacylase/putative intracellular protease/amidase
VKSCHLYSSVKVRALRLWLFVANLAALVVPASADATRTSGVVAEGTPFATPYYVQESGEPGLTVVLTGGIHGNEPAGALAAEQIRRWPIVRGKLVVLPRANVPALAADKRYTPGAEEPLRNLNRNFPKADGKTPARGTPAKEIWRFVASQQPDWVVDLHEGFDFHQINPESVGSSIIAYPTASNCRVVPRLLAVVNETVGEKPKKFVHLRSQADGSLARAVHERLGRPSLILETTRKDQPLSKRARQHRLMVHRLLSTLKMIDATIDVDRLVDPADARIAVALYDAGGVGGKGPGRLLRLLGDWEQTTIERIGVAEIRRGRLDQFDVVIFPGGSGSKQSAALGESGRKRVSEFVENGGGYIGICGGAYLACDGFSWGLKVLDAKTKSPKWRRGRATVEMELTEAGRDVFARNGRLNVNYHNGPILAPSQSDALPDYTALGIFRSEVAENDSPRGIMIDSPAVVAGRYSRGRVLCFSPHPESTEGLEEMVRRAVAWAAKNGREGF